MSEIQISLQASDAPPEFNAMFKSVVAAIDNLPAKNRATDAQLETLYSIAHGAHTQGQYERAEEFLGMLLYFRPTDPRFLQARALNCKKRGQFLDAFGSFGFLAMIEPDNLTHSVSAAECLLLNGDAELAAASLKGVINACDERGLSGTIKERAIGLLALSEKRGNPA